jgi:hypothetical protein
LEMFLAIARDNESVRFVQAQLKNADRVAELTTRAYQRTQEPVDPRYENQWDVALAVYLWLLATENPRYALPVAYSVIVTPQCWWARQLARKIVLGAYRAEGATEADIPSPKGVLLPQIVNVIVAGETILAPVSSLGIIAENIRFVLFGNAQQEAGIDIGPLEMFTEGVPRWNSQTEGTASNLEPIGAK